MKHFILFITLILGTASLYAQMDSGLKKTLEITRVSKGPKIDGDLTDEAWENVAVAKDFIMFRPSTGNEPEGKKTEVKVVYTNEAIYFGAYLYDDDLDAIPKQLADRDDFGQTDFFGVTINTNNDQINMTEFFVTSTGGQADATINTNGEDFSWNAVWDSAIDYKENGWIVEIRIPYAALRFASKEKHLWGINFHRRFQSTREQYTWNFIDRTKGTMGQYDGLLTGITKIDSPVRLNLYPYASTNNLMYEGEVESTFNAGMDIKYGLTKNFTLDATLIPDFGQAGFDNVIQNLGPFEQRFNEQRAFFTEGLDLFNQLNLFYSRRVGGEPIGFNNVDDTLEENEEIIENPSKANLINAIKVSGRTQKGLGIGFFNAISRETKAEIINTETNSTRKVTTEPLTNYNVLVLDQQFNGNSNVTLINTNTTRNGSFRDANVTGLLFRIVNKKNTVFADGAYVLSNVRENSKNTSGYFADLSIGKNAGNLQYELGASVESDTYDINDLGFLRANNSKEYYGNVSYQTFKPKGKLNSYRIEMWGNRSYLFEPDAYTNTKVGANARFFTKEFNAFGFNLDSTIGNNYDYFEPRIDGQFVKYSPSFGVSNWISTDYRKKFAFDTEVGYETFFDNDQKNYYYNLSPRYRVNNHLQFIYGFNWSKQYQQPGFVTISDQGTESSADDISIFGIRNRKTITNELTAKYSFSVKTSLNLSFRHYWSALEYNDIFFDLVQEGNLQANQYSENHNGNFNAWNIDLNYSWNFAPGSFITALYRNSIYQSDDLKKVNTIDNLNNTLDSSMEHTFSVKVIYFIEYNQLKSLF